MLPRLRLPLRVKNPPSAIGYPAALRPPCFELELPCLPGGVHSPLTRGNAQRCENSSLEGTMRRRSWPNRRISLPLSDFARLWSKSAIHAPSSDHEPAGSIVHTTPRPTLTQTQRLRGRRYGRDREFLRPTISGMQAMHPYDRKIRSSSPSDNSRLFIWRTSKVPSLRGAKRAEILSAAQELGRQVIILETGVASY